jgi:hypothetical protein
MHGVDCLRPGCVQGASRCIHGCLLPTVYVVVTAATGHIDMQGKANADDQSSTRTSASWARASQLAPE